MAPAPIDWLVKEKVVPRRNSWTSAVVTPERNVTVEVFPEATISPTIFVPIRTTRPSELTPESPEPVVPIWAIRLAPLESETFQVAPPQSPAPLARLANSGSPGSARGSSASGAEQLEALRHLAEIHGE